MGGIFAVSTVLPGKVQQLAFHLKTINRFGTDGILNQGLQILGCFLVLSVLIWASKSEPNPRQTTAGIPTTQQGHGAGACRWSADWCTADAAMRTELLIALGIPAAYLLVSTLLLLQRPQTLPPFLQRISARRAIAWNTMVGLSIGVGAIRWALSR